MSEELSTQQLVKEINAALINWRHGPSSWSEASAVIDRLGHRLIAREQALQAKIDALIPGRQKLSDDYVGRAMVLAMNIKYGGNVEVDALRAHLTEAETSAEQKLMQPTQEDCARFFAGRPMETAGLSEEVIEAEFHRRGGLGDSYFDWFAMGVEYAERRHGITPPQPKPCEGANCGSTDGLTHSSECLAEADAAFVAMSKDDQSCDRN